VAVVTDPESAAAHELAHALARLTAAVEKLEAAAEHVRRREATPIGASIEATREELNALREMHLSVSRQLDTAISRLRVLVKSE
jgi:hypothetical protein